MQQKHDEERRSYEQRNEVERKNLVNQADNDRTEQVKKQHEEKKHFESVIDGLKAQNAKALADKESL